MHFNLLHRSATALRALTWSSGVAYPRRSASVFLPLSCAQTVLPRGAYQLASAYA